LKYPDVPHVVSINPPVDPHPVALAVEAFGVIRNTLVLLAPVIATCTVELQVFADTLAVLVVNVVRVCAAVAVAAELTDKPLASAQTGAAALPVATSVIT
jgi:hypothetical protein